MGDNNKLTMYALAIIGLGLGYVLYSGALISNIGMNGIQAQQMRADSLQDSINYLQTKITNAKKDLAKESPEDVKKRVESYRASLAVLRTLVPEQREVANLLDDISMRARMRGVQLSGFSPIAPATGPAPFDTYSYNFTVVGHYNNVGAFLTDVASLRRIMVPGDVSMKGADPTQAKAFGDTTAMVEAHLTVRTYVKAKSAEDSAHAK